MDLWILKPGHKIKMRDGAEAVVLSETADGAWIRVRYLAGGDKAVPAAAEDLVHEDEVRALLGVATTGTWDDTVTVIIHRRPETSDFPGGYKGAAGGRRSSTSTSRIAYSAGLVLAFLIRASARTAATG